ATKGSKPKILTSKHCRRVGMAAKSKKEMLMFFSHSRGPGRYLIRPGPAQILANAAQGNPSPQMKFPWFAGSRSLYIDNKRGEERASVHRSRSSIYLGAALSCRGNTRSILRN